MQYDVRYSYIRCIAPDMFSSRDYFSHNVAVSVHASVSCHYDWSEHVDVSAHTTVKLLTHLLGLQTLYSPGLSSMRDRVTLK